MINHQKELLRCTCRLSNKTNYYRKSQTLNKDDAKCRCICTNRSKYASLKRYNLSTCLFETTDPIIADPIYSSQSGYTCIRDDQPLQPNPRRARRDGWRGPGTRKLISIDQSIRPRCTIEKPNDRARDSPRKTRHDVKRTPTRARTHAHTHTYTQRNREYIRHTRRRLVDD